MRILFQHVSLHKIVIKYIFVTFMNILDNKALFNLYWYIILFFKL